MKKLLTSSDVTLLSFYKSILEENNIATMIKNYYLTGGIGDLPPNEVVPELWVIDDNQYQAAREVLNAKKEADWQCSCGERIEGQFNECWKCGKLRS